MILGFADKETAKIYAGEFSRRLPLSIQRTAYMKLVYMNTVSLLDDLRSPPSNHLEQLHDTREGQYSIRINRQYRICFTVRDMGFDDVEITDYH